MSSDGDQSRLVDEAYRPPTSDSDRNAGDEHRDAGDARRAAATFLLVLASFHVLIWMTRLVLNFPNSWLAPTRVLIDLVLGVALRRSSAAVWRVGAILLPASAGALLAAPHMVNSVHSGAPAFLFLAPVLGWIVRASPFLLLLLGKPGRARRRSAMGLAALQVILEVAGSVFGLAEAGRIARGQAG
jgi:hypothetical protein